MNASEIFLHAREEPGSMGGAAHGVRVLLALTFGAVVWSEYYGRAPAAAPWSTWALLVSGISLLASSILYDGSVSHNRPASTLAALATLSTKLYFASVLHPAASSASCRLLQSGAFLTALSAVPVVALGCIPVEGLQCEGHGCFPVDSWAALAGIVAGFSTFMDLALVGVTLRIALKRPFDPRERRAEALAMACSAAAFIAGLVKLTKLRPLSTGDFTQSLLLWTTTESCLTILSGTTIAPYTARKRAKGPRSPPTDDGAGQTFEMGREEWGEGAPSESELLRRSMVRAGLL